MNKWIRVILLILLTGLLFYSDFIRDYFFKNISFQIYYLHHTLESGYSSIENYTDSSLENLLANFSISDLIKLKWSLTIGFTIYFGLLCSLISYLFYQRKEVFKFILLLYSSIFIVASIIYISRYISADYNWQENTYLIAMQSLHFLQSSLPTLFFVASFKIYLSYKDSAINN